MAESVEKEEKHKNKRFNINYFFRIDTKTIQGKITGAFLLVALIATSMLLVNTRTWRNISADYEKALKEINPTRLMMLELQGVVIYTYGLSIQMTAVKDDQILKKRDSLWGKLAKNHLDSLSKSELLLENENLERYFMAYRDVIMAVRSAQHEIVANGNFDDLFDTDFQDQLAETQSLGQRFLDELLKMEESYIEKADQAKDNLNFLLIIQYIFAFILSTLVASAIIVNVLRKIKALKLKIREMAHGDLPDEIPSTTDEMNAITSALNELVSNLRSITHFASEVGQGKFDSDITVFNNQGHLGKSLAEMRDSLKKVAEEDKQRVWFNEGIARFGDIQRSHNTNIEELTDAVMSEMVNYAAVNQGSIFIVNIDEDKEVSLEMKASYAFDRKKYTEKTLKPGQSLVGQAYLEKDVIHLTEIPSSYINITSGLGDGSPTNLLIVPMIINEEVVGVIEVAAFHPFSDNVISFIKRVAENLAATIQTVQINQETNRLLEESQMRAEQMQAQEEEMRQNMEEMQATQEEMSRLKNQSDYIFDNFDGVVFICANDADFTMEFMSKGMEELSGYPAEDFVNGKRSMVQIFSETTRKNQEELIDQPISAAFENKQYYRIEYNITHKNGHEVQVIEKGRGVYDRGGEVIKMVGFITRV